MTHLSHFQRTGLSFLMTLFVYGAIALLLLTPWYQTEVIEPLKDVTPLMRLITQVSVLETPQQASESASLTPVQQRRVIMQQPAPAAPRKAIAERKAHKAVATKPQPNIPASTRDQVAVALPTAPQQPEAITSVSVTSQTQVTSDLSAQTPSLSASAIKDIAAAYRSMVHGRIAALQQYPVLAKRMGEEGTVLVRFTILASGKISNVVIMESSGSQSLDVAAVDIFMQGLNGQLPPIPPELNKSEWTLSLPIRYQLQ